MTTNTASVGWVSIDQGRVVRRQAACPPAHQAAPADSCSVLQLANLRFSLQVKEICDVYVTKKIN